MIALSFTIVEISLTEQNEVRYLETYSVLNSALVVYQHLHFDPKNVGHAGFLKYELTTMKFCWVS